MAIKERHPTYLVRKVGQGWQCRVRRSKACGWGSKPLLAILDWRKQDKLLDSTTLAAGLAEDDATGENVPYAGEGDSDGRPN